MPSETINMHGKIYTLLDEKIRVEKVAQIKAQEIRDGGQVAFLNPQKRKDKETNYWIYVAEKSVRRASSRKSISSKVLLEEYKKGASSFKEFMLELERVQKEVPKNLPINESVKETPKKVVLKKTTTKKASKKTNGKKLSSKAMKNTKKAPSKK